mgnify:CR=1 FL=1
MPPLSLPQGSPPNQKCLCKAFSKNNKQHKSRGADNLFRLAKRQPEKNCPYGITSPKPEMRARLDPMEGGQKLANFIHACTEEVKILTMLSGHSAIRDLSTEDLRAMDLNTAALTGLKLAGYDRPLPIWEALGGNGNGNGNGHH